MQHGAPFDLVLLLRHDLYFFQPLDLTIVDPAALTTPPWCYPMIKAWPEETSLPERVCAPYAPNAKAYGINDYFFLGGQVSHSQLIHPFTHSLMINPSSFMLGRSSYLGQREGVEHDGDIAEAV